MSKRRLGKGIDALLQGRPLEQLSQMASILMVDVDRIEPNPDQPRKQFSQERLNELAASIREKGVIQPILAEDRGDGTYTVVAGERRFRAAKLAGLTEIPVISQDFTSEEKLEIALIENIQREDLNPIDEARAMQRAMEHSGATQEELARRLGKSRSAIANTLRLLRLDPDIQQALSDGTLTAGHARALLAVEDDTARRELFDRILADHLSVREAERLARGSSGEDPNIQLEGDSLEIPEAGEQADAVPTDAAVRGSAGSSSGSGTARPKSIELRRIEDRLVERFGTRVVIRGTNRRGRIEIHYLTTEDLERAVEAMGAEFE